MPESNPKNSVRLRFAPSPTGFLHIGSLRTALFDYVIAKKLGGKLILRIEDTDQKREVPGAVESLVKILNWIGIEFDEGPHAGGDYDPYTQTERLDIYKKYEEELVKKGGAYYCFCSPERLEELRNKQQAEKRAPRYDRHCREMKAEEVNERIAAGERYVIRQKMPLEGKILVHDELRGDIEFDANELEDHVLVKSNAIPTYQFASVVDDHLMEISHVVRGEEWLPSFPKNILLYQSFGWTPPKFVHLALTLNKGGGKLSKRQGDVAVEDYRAKGYLPEALINFCILQGWHPKGDNEVLTLDEIIEKFEIKDMGTSPAVFDIEKLDYFNGYYIRQKPLDELTKLCVPYLVEAGMINSHNSQPITHNAQPINPDSQFKTKGERIVNLAFLKDVIALEQERMKKLSEIIVLTEFFFLDKLEYDPELLVWKKMKKEDVQPKLKEISKVLERIPENFWTNDSIEEAIKSHIEAKNGQMGEYLWPLRVALTGLKASPPPFDIAEVLGKEESIKRVKQAINKEWLIYEVQS
ncbi:MAG: glutamate--tRNA ligase [Patescibacteria group bacterium]|jgi:glutamyl-tRNA synthetase